MKKKILSYMLAASMLLPMLPNTVMAATEEINPDMSNWIAYDPPTSSDIEGTILDASNLLDAPAGKHGYLNHYEGDNFYFEDNTEARFWGVDVTANNCYPTHEVAEETAKRIAQSGFNLVRLHLIDSGALWGPKDTGGRMMKEDILDRVCYLISELKKRGVYIFIDMMISMPITSDLSDTYDIENLPSALKYYSYTEEDLKEETMKYTRALLSCYNKYTGMKLLDDPAIALIDLKNEDSIGCFGNMESDKYRANIQKRYNNWLIEKYGNTENLVAAWEDDKDSANPRPALDDGENLEDKTVKIFEEITLGDTTYDGVNGLWTRRNARCVDEFKFRSMLMEEYYNSCISEMRNMGVKCMITGSTSWSSNGFDRNSYYANRNTDFTDVHYYHAMPSSNNYGDGVTRTDAIKSILERDGNDLRAYSMINNIGIRRVKGHPMTISEWNDVAPNKYRSETILMMSAYSALNGINPVAFAWGETSSLCSATKDTYIKRTFGTAETPEYALVFPTVARMFLRNDVSETESNFYGTRLQGNEAFTVSSQYLGNKGMYNMYLPLIGKSGMVFEDAYNEADNDNTILQLAYDAYNGDKNFVSITGELSMDYNNKMFKVNTPKAQAISGFTQNQTVELDDVKFDLDNYYATAYLNSVDDNPLYSSKEMLLTLVGDTRNTGQVMSEDEEKPEMKIETGGTGPVLCEPITGTVTIKTDKLITVKKVSTKGEVGRTNVQLTKVTGGYSFKLDGDSLYYRITRTNSVNPSQNAHVSLGNSSAHNVYSDVDASNPSKKEIERCAWAGYIGAYSGTKFEPTALATRKEALNAILKAMKVSDRVWTGSTSNYSYGDIAYNEEGFEGMADAAYIGLITPRWSGLKKNCVLPNEKVTRREALVWIAKAYGNGSYPSNRTKKPDASFSLSRYSDYSSVSSDDADYFRTTLGLGYMSDKNGKIAQNDYLTRQEVAEIAYNIAWR